MMKQQQHFVYLFACIFKVMSFCHTRTLGMLNMEFVHDPTTQIIVVLNIILETKIKCPTKNRQNFPRITNGTSIIMDISF